MEKISNVIVRFKSIPDVKLVAVKYDKLFCNGCYLFDNNIKGVPCADDGTQGIELCMSKKYKWKEVE